jgi:hypothetical protein
MEVRQVQVVGEFVRECAQPTVLRLDGVVADPEVGVANLRATQPVEVRSDAADQV